MTNTPIDGSFCRTRGASARRALSDVCSHVAVPGRGRFARALAVSGAIIFFSTQAGAEVTAGNTFEHKIWKGGAAVADSSTACRMTGRYAAGSYLAFEYNATGLIMKLGYAPWKFPPGTQQPFRLSVDGKWRMSQRVTVRSMEGNGKWVADISIGRSEKAMRVLRYGRVLTVRAKPGAARYPLTGTLVALHKLRECYVIQVELSKQRKLRMADPDPFKDWTPISLRE